MYTSCKVRSLNFAVLVPPCLVWTMIWRSVKVYILSGLQQVYPSFDNILSGIRIGLALKIFKNLPGLVNTLLGLIIRGPLSTVK